MYMWSPVREKKNCKPWAQKPTLASTHSGTYNTNILGQSPNSHESTSNAFSYSWPSRDPLDTSYFQNKGSIRVQKFRGFSESAVLSVKVSTIASIYILYKSRVLLFAKTTSNKVSIRVQKCWVSCVLLQSGLYSLFIKKKTHFLCTCFGINKYDKSFVHTLLRE